MSCVDPMAELPPEGQLLFQMVRPRMSAEVNRNAERLLAGAINWESLRQMATRQGVASLLYRNLIEMLPSRVPAEVLQELRSNYLNNAGRNLFWSAELGKVVRLFDSHGISALAFKGPILNGLLYGEESLREYYDLDILIRRNDVARAKELLLSLGYRTEVDLAHPEKAPFLRYHRELLFERDNGRIIDLHWSLGGDQFPTPVAADRAWRRRVRVEVQGSDVPTLCSEDLALYLCFHGGKHFWSRLSWLCDLARLLEIEKELRWGLLMEQAAAAGYERMVLLGLHLAHELLGAPVPEHLRDRARNDEAVRLLAERVWRRLAVETPEQPGIGESGGFLLRLIERPTDKLRYLIGVTMTPTLAEWRVIKLPPALFFIYYLFRPLRLLAKYMAAALNDHSSE